MHRFRVWAASLKAFLWPENWLSPEGHLRISGRVTDRQARPVTALAVRAFAVSAHADELFGESTTGTDGRYELTASADRVGADVRIDVFDAQGARLGSSPIVFGVAPAQTIDVTV
jgi:hypothetical protein